MLLTQKDAPLMDALKDHLMNRVVRFDVPGHKGGRGNRELADFLGDRCVQIDVNSMKNLDNLCHPVSVLRDAQQLAAEAFGAANAFFIINGATGASQAMIMSVCKSGDKLIMPRNVHRSAINALVVNGAIPVYVDPGENKELGIPLGMSVEAVERAILENPDAKAVLVNNPTYYGVCPDIRRIAKLAHEHGMLLLADEAHGTHFYFGENLPCSAMAAGAARKASSAPLKSLSAICLPGFQLFAAHKPAKTAAPTLYFFLSSLISSSSGVLGVSTVEALLSASAALVFLVAICSAPFLVFIYRLHYQLGDLGEVCVSINAAIKPYLDLHGDLCF